MSYPINLNRTELEYLIRAVDNNTGGGTRQEIHKKLLVAKLKHEWVAHETTLACLPKAMLETFLSALHIHVGCLGSATLEQVAAHETLTAAIAAMK